MGGHFFIVLILFEILNQVKQMCMTAGKELRDHIF